MIGLKLRFVMREWTDMFRILAEGANAAVETKLEKAWPSRSDWPISTGCSSQRLAFLAPRK